MAANTCRFQVRQVLAAICSKVYCIWTIFLNLFINDYDKSPRYGKIFDKSMQKQRIDISKSISKCFFCKNGLSMNQTKTVEIQLSRFQKSDRG